MANGWGGKRANAGRHLGPASPTALLKVREKIKINQILKRLNQFIMGEIDMPPAAVTAAAILLRKVMPDLAAVEYTGGLELKDASKMTDNEIATELEATARALGKAGGTARDLPIVH